MPGLGKKLDKRWTLIITSLSSIFSLGMLEDKTSQLQTIDGTKWEIPYLKPFKHCKYITEHAVFVGYLNHAPSFQNLSTDVAIGRMIGCPSGTAVHFSLYWILDTVLSLV